MVCPVVRCSLYMTSRDPMVEWRIWSVLKTHYQTTLVWGPATKRSAFFAVRIPGRLPHFCPDSSDLLSDSQQSICNNSESYTLNSYWGEPRLSCRNATYSSVSD